MDGAPAVDVLFKRFDAAVKACGYLAMGGQIVDATIVAAPKQRNTKDEKQAIKEGRIPDDWTAKPAKLRQKDRDARWTVKYTKAKPRDDGLPIVDLAIPAFGYKNHIGIDRRHGPMTGLGRGKQTFIASPLGWIITVFRPAQRGVSVVDAVESYELERRLTCVRTRTSCATRTQTCELPQKSGHSPAAPAFCIRWVTGRMPRISASDR
jgi:hypothetical protein